MKMTKSFYSSDASYTFFALQFSGKGKSMYISLSIFLPNINHIFQYCTEKIIMEIEMSERAVMPVDWEGVVVMVGEGGGEEGW